MADASVTVELTAKGDTLRKQAEKAGDSFGNRIQHSLESNLRKLGISEFKPITGKSSEGGKGMSDAVKTGITGGLAAGGIIKVLDFIAGLLMDFPIVAAILKIFKVILTLLLLPLIPILRPVLLALQVMAQVLAPIMMTISDWIQKLFDAISNVVNNVGGALFNIGAWLSENLIKWITGIFKFDVWMEETIVKLFIGVFDFGSWIGTAIWNFITGSFDFGKWILDNIWNFLTGNKGNTPVSNVATVAPSDITYMATHPEKNLGSAGGISLNINFDNTQVSKSSDISAIKDQVTEAGRLLTQQLKNVGYKIT